jgi:hypothetical protein
VKPLFFAAVAATLLAAATAEAVEGPGDTQALPCRPTIACTADIVPPGALELEGGGIYRRLAGRENQVTVPFLAKLTLATWLQLQVGTSGYTRLSGGAATPAVEYVDDISMGAKLHIVDQGATTPSVSASFAVLVPSFAHGSVSETDDIAMTLYASKDFGPLHADLNAGLNRYGVNALPASQGWVSLSLSTSLPAHFGIAVENYYFEPAQPFASRDAGGLVALTYTALSWLVLDAGFDVGYVEATRDYSLFGGMTVVPLRLWKKE